MLTLPGTGFQLSARKNNVNPIALGDWIEASVLFSGDSVSRSEVADVLMEQLVTEDQNIAAEIAEAGWLEVEGRLKSAVAPGVQVAGKKIVPVADWRNDIARSFLLAVSLADGYRDWAEDHRDLIGQGDLFEKLCVEACGHIFQGWHVERAGWSAAGPRRVTDLAVELAALVGTVGNPNAVEHWIAPMAKDAGLDIFCFRRFDDGREGAPMFMIQCASGQNWTAKLDEPAVGQWVQILGSAYPATRAVMIPFVVGQKDLRIRCAKITGPLFDRLRILSSPVGSSAWVSPGLMAELEAWLAPRIAALPTN